jgi:hypothetical protein
MTTTRSVVRWTPALGVTAVLVGALLPWLASGRVERNSYQLIASARRLDLFDNAGERALALLWYLLPLAVLVAALAVGARRQFLAAVVAVAAGATGLALVAIVGDVPFPLRAGREVTWWAAMFSIIAGPVSVWTDRRGHRRERPN